jgi:ERCC4-type nuclease
MKPAMPRIQIDPREKRPWIFPDDVEIIRETLTTGDYSLQDFESEISIERKSLSDLVMCCASAERERFVRAIERLAVIPCRAIIVEADLRDITAHAYRSEAHPNSIVGSVVAFFVDHGVPTFFASDARDGAALALRIFRRWWAKRLEAIGSGEAA